MSYQEIQHIRDVQVGGNRAFVPVHVSQPQQDRKGWRELVEAWLAEFVLQVRP